LEAFPLVWAALQEQEIAGGNLTASLGAYDLQAFAFSNSQPLGFYQNHRHAIGFSQLRATDGSRWFSGYRLGDGRFPDWYGERLTNRGGELAVGANIPLRRDRDIDPQRARWFKAEQQTLAAEPYIQQQQNVFVRDATAAYWRWLSAGMRRNVQQRILDLARDRARQIERRVQQGDLPELSLIDNDRLIAQREAAAIDAEQAYQAATIQLSLFLRDPTGRPLQVSDQRRPATFPELVLPELPHSDEEIRRVLQAHPALAVLNLQIQQQQVDVQLARNLVLPRLDLFWETSQDLGAASSASRDKSPFELETGFVADVPLQRREAVGQLAAARARLEQLQWERSFLEDSLMTSLQEQIAAMANARQRFERALANVRLAEQALEIGRRAFLAGDIDLIVLNIYEQSLADAVLLQIDAQRAFFLAAVEYRLALGLPMDRSP
ncbi:MAG TPA: TolC family protein, partial [Pirellulaceae bacterium]|nr:TolC family protein [Pirellulaceae bacterium]